MIYGLLLAACASTQLNYNTEELASTVDKLIKDQVVQNLGRFLDDPSAIPAQVSIPAGSVTTTNQLSASVTDPITRALTITQQGVMSGAPSLTNIASSVYATPTITPGVNNQAAQNWALSPIGDSDQIRRLRALYRYATAAPGADLCSEYPLVMTSVPMQSSTPDGGVPVVVNHSSMASDDAAWTSATQADLAIPDPELVIPLYGKYLQEFPRGPHAQAAQWRIDQLKRPTQAKEEAAWTRAITQDDIQSYETFLATYRDKSDPYVAKASDRLSVLAAAQIAKTSKPTAFARSTSLIPDGSFLTEPGCVICSTASNENNISKSSFVPPANYCRNPADAGHGVRPDLYINPRLTKSWLEFVRGGGPTFLADGAALIGNAHGYSLYANNSDEFNQFVIFVIEGTAESSGASSGAGGGKAGAPKGATFALPPASAFQQLF